MFEALTDYIAKKHEIYLLKDITFDTKRPFEPIDLAGIRRIVGFDAVKYVITPEYQLIMSAECIDHLGIGRGGAAICVP